jgi:hypothetical protein
MANKNKNGHFVNMALPLGTWVCGYNEESFVLFFTSYTFFLRISSVTIFSGGVVSFLAGGLNERVDQHPPDIGLRVTNECRDFGPHKRQSQLESFFVNNSVSLPTRFIDDRSFFSIQFTEDFLSSYYRRAVGCELYFLVVT